MAFLRILLIFALFYFGIRLLGRILFPPRNSNYNNRDSFDGRSKKKEGEVTVENKDSSGKKINKDEGDYIDYEEVKE